MFFCSSSGSDPLSMSKSDILRGIITEKLSTAAREILAVVERTVTDYEKEASGFRQQIDRQRRQLELLQPQVKLHRGGQWWTEDLQSHEEVVVGEEQEEQQLMENTGVDGAGSPSLRGKHSEDEEKVEDPATICELVQEDPKDPDYEVPPRSVQPGNKRRHLSPVIDTQDPLNLRIRILEESETEVLSNSVFQKSPVWDLGCPHGLDEAAFLDLLRSTFPQLAAGKPFDIFTTDKSRKLQPLSVKALTPEEISTAIRSLGNSALYIRPKKEMQEREEYPVPESPTVDPEIIKNQETELHMSSGQRVDGSNENALFSSTSQQQDLQTEEGEAESNMDFSGDEEDEDGGLDGDEDWEPNDELETPTRKKRTSSDKSVIHSVEDTNDKSESNADPRSESYRALDERNSDPELQTPNKKRRKGRWERKERGKIFCKVCGVFYRQFGSLVRHIWMHVSDPQRVCGACGEKSESVDQLKEHIHSHKKPYSCPDCGKPFFSKDGVKRHAAKHAGSNLFKCSVCGKSSPNQYTLNLHRWVHIENKPHKCDICPKSFGLESQLRAHRKRHMANDAYKCHMCNKSLRSRRSLARHMLTHSDERHYSCETCGNRFKSDAGLKSHEKTHEVRDRPFLCHICCMTFPLKQSLMSHLRIHSSERPFVCSLCGKGFTFQGNLNKHMKAHTSEAPFKCCECGRCFKHKNHLTQHIKIHSGIKQFVCGVCGKGCSNQEHLKVHMRTHTGERPYECSLCDRAFTQSHCLKTHMKTHQNKDEAVLGPSRS
ncbi:zinc finger protein 436-like isoform X1 [Girardinichthys multiradiatus]|uniref:zinc finger protein 436-like isoform X1 n=1 Tax=Girardinichthys multiradiatus TaxID=208333 RepID=UPI001FAD773A|nr:zinc finger protein 436-like isoform X1 [Girardinichthys multiradiatus]